MMPKYDYDFDPNARNNTASTIWRLVRDAGAERVLDLGSGPGIVAAALVAEGVDVTCVDTDEEALAAAQERGVPRTIVGDLAADGWLDEIRGEQFDVVVLADVLEHLVDPGALLDTIRRQELVRDDGHLVVSVPNIGHEAVVLGLALGRFHYTETGLLDGTHVRFFTRESLHGLLEEHGFLVRQLHRTERTAEQTEQFPIARDVPTELRSLLRDVAPDGRAYQFVVAATPSSTAGQLAILRDRLQEERETHVRAQEDMRADLRSKHEAAIQSLQEKHTKDRDRRVVELEQELAAAGREHDALREAHEQLEREYVRLEQQLVEAEDRGRELASMVTAARGPSESTFRVLRDEIQRLHGAVAEGDAEVRRLYDALKSAEDRLDLVYESSSFRVGWALSSPVRALRGRSGDPVRPPRVTMPDGSDAPFASVAGPRVGTSYDTSAPPDADGRVSPYPTRRAAYEVEVAREGFSPDKRGVVMLCSTVDLDAGRGDLYAACGLGLGLREHGMEAVYREHDRWSELPKGTDVVVSYIAERTMILDPASLPPDVLRVAWIRNNTKRWIEEGSLGLYDLVLCSSQLTADHVREHHAGPVEVLPLGVDPDLFTPGDVPTPRRGVVSTINQWGAPRRTYQALARATLSVPLRVYGRGENLDASVKQHHRGFVSFFEVPSLYREAAVVLDDQQGVNAPYGNVNSRIFEALAAGALPLTASPLGLSDVGLGDVPVWRHDDELEERIAYWTEHEDERDALVARLRDVVVREHSFEARAAQFVDLIADRPRRRPSVIGFYPDYRVTNPFQDMVYAGAVGRVIRPVEGPAAFAAAPGLQDHPRIFHLHWIATVLGPAGEDAAEAERRADAFLAELDDARAAGIGIVWTIHNVLHHESKHPATEVRLRQGIADRADLVHVLSPETLDAIEAAGYSVPADRVYLGTHPSYVGVYPSAVSRTAARRRLGLPEGAFVYLALGQIRPYKGLERLLDGFERHAGRHADSRLLVAGLPGRFPGVAELLERARATPGTTLVDRHVDDEELQVFLRAANVVVLPHRRVLNSGLLWLAWSFARPVVAPDTGALSGLVDPAVGVLFDADADDLAPALAAARHLGASHGRAAFARAEAAHPRVVGPRLLTAIDAAVDRADTSHRR